MTKKEAIGWLEKDIKLHEVFNETKHQNKVLEALEMAIKALEQEPKRGEWIDKGNFYICSECGKRMPYAVLGSKLSRAYAFMSDYCPNCGARMKRL